MNDDFPTEDLAGGPYQELPDPRGRKKHRITEEIRRDVSDLRASGMPQKEVAEAIGISEYILTNYYFQELNSGVPKARARALLNLRNSAEAGNVSAQKAWLKQLESGRGVPPVPKAPANPDAGLGKKERALQAGRRKPEGSWGDLLKH